LQQVRLPERLAVNGVLIMTAAARPNSQDPEAPSTASLARAHVLIATQDEDFEWSVFEGLRGHESLRVTGCPSVRQTRQICSTDPPDVIVVDLELLENEPLALVSLASCAPATTRIVGLTEHAVDDVGARFGEARVSFLQKPVDVNDLVFLMTLDSFSVPA
jgi:DNA-binding NtrC family response regulator